MEEPRLKNLAWNDDTVYAIGLYRMIGRILGIWPLQCHDIGSKVRFLFLNISQLIMNYNLIREFLSGCISLLDAIDFIGLFAENTAGLLKIILIRVNQKKMHLIVQSAVDDWSNVRDEKSYNIMRKHTYFGKFVFIFQLSTAYISAITQILGAPPIFHQITDESPHEINSSILVLRNLPMGSGCSVVNWSTFLYLSFYFFQFIQLLCMCNCAMGSDAIFFGLVMHLCAQIELLKVDMSRLGQDFNAMRVRHDLTELIKKHNHLAALVNLIEEVFHLFILGLLAGTYFHMTVTGVKMLHGLRERDFILFLNGLIVLGILIVRLYLYTYTGDYLASQINELRDAVYNSTWYNFPPCIVKDVMFMIMRSSDRFHLTAGKVCRINIENFTSMIKTMVSFFTVLNLMFEE